MMNEITIKKKRGCNYTSMEKEILLDILKGHKNIVENKETNGVMIRKKQNAWTIITRQYNAVATSGPRTWVQLRHLYENIKQRSKRNIAKENGQQIYKREKEPDDVEEIAEEIEVEPIVECTELGSEAASDPLSTHEWPDSQLNSFKQEVPEIPEIQPTTSNPKPIDNGRRLVRNGKNAKSTTKEQYFKVKLHTARLERKFLIQRHELEMELLRAKLKKISGTKRIAQY